VTGLRVLARERRGSGSGTVHPADPDPLPRALEAEFPGWHFWRSNGGRLWAVRTGARAQWETDRDGPPMTVDADDEDAMREVLGELPDIQGPRAGEASGW
jgi:hypothetical protein